MKLSEYAKKVGVHYDTAWRWYRAGKIQGYQMDTGTIIITEGQEAPSMQKTVVYGRVSSHEMKDNLDRQINRLLDYCAAKGYQVDRVVKEIGSGVNDNRAKFCKLLSDPEVTVIVVEHKDRATRFGFNYLTILLEQQGRRLEVVNQPDNNRDDLLADLTSIIYSFCARLYGHRRAKRKTEKMTKELIENGS